MRIRNRTLVGICSLSLGLVRWRTRRRLKSTGIPLCAAAFSFLSVAAIGSSQEPPSDATSHDSSVKQAVEWKGTDHVLVHRPDADIDIDGKNATVTFNDTPMPFMFEFENSGVIGGVKRSILRFGRSLTLNGGWKVSFSGHQVLNTANGGMVPGGNGGTVMRACRELLDAMKDAQTAAARNGTTFTPVGKGALEDFVRARTL